MNLSRRRIVWGLVVALLVVFAAVPAIRWRVALVTLKSVGELDSVDWSEMAYVLRPNTNVRLSRLTRNRNPFVDVTNPVDTPSDRARGKEQFADHCSRCHGDAAQGGAGPALVGRSLRHGDSDWAKFRTIHHGVPGTAMLPVLLPRDDIWRIIGYLRQLSYQQLAAGESAGSAGESASAPVVPATSAMLLAAADDVDDWLLPFHSYSAQRFTPDTQINATNVSHLTVHWIHQFDTIDQRIESVPIVVGGRMYVTLPQGSVYAIDAATGAQLWEFDRAPPADVRLCCVTTNRGVAVLGSRVYVGTLDAHLLALDAAAGTLIWDQTVANYKQGYSLTSAPLPIGDTVVSGIAGGDFPIRGFVSAYDANTGNLRWRTYTTPAPGEPGHDSWGKADAWSIGGSATWGSGAFDPNLGLLYWGTGNPAPDFNATNRPGDNLYSNSLLALDAATGQLRWHFQFTPHDTHDWDSIQTPALIEESDHGATAAELAVANRNGFYYVLDRASGKFVRGAAYVKQTWASGLDSNGRPVRLPDTDGTPGGTLVYPSTNGGANWWMAAYSPITKLSYVDVQERGGMFFANEEPPDPKSGRLYTGSGGRYVDGDFHYAALRAIDPATAKVRWEHRNLGYNDWPRGGVLATAGGLVFGSDASSLFALDATTGAVLWSFDTGGQICSPPISYRSNGHEYVVVSAGQVLMAFALPDAPHTP